ncbi:TonB-dependent receptor [soil metagenome]
MVRQFALLFLFSSVAAQAPADTLEVDLSAITVTAEPLREGAQGTPNGVSVLARSETELATDPGASLEPLLRRLPGIWVADRENFALGERLAVRGMGARAGFGVRGVRVVMDGVPLTMADGQTAMTIVDPSLVRRVELVRGPASSAWGNSSGGVLFLETLPAEVGARLRAAAGSFGLVRTDGEFTTDIGTARVGMAASHLRRAGYREHSAFETTRLRSFASADLGAWGRVRATAALEHAPHQQHPGALTEIEFADAPRTAQQNFVSQGAGKSSTQGQFGIAHEVPAGGGQLAISTFGIARSLQNPLPFAIIEVDRLAGGGRAAFSRRDGPARWSLGGEVNAQRDDRLNFANEGGEPGAVRLDQFETVVNGALFTTLALESGALTVSGGLRADQVRFAVRNRLGSTDNDSSAETLTAVSPSIGAAYRIAETTVFASFATGFDTPTTTELANRPDGLAGFNANLRPQRTRGFESGIRAALLSGRVFADVALFHLDVTDQITAFEGADGRTYYRNADATHHTGFESLVEWRAADGLDLGASYSWSRNVFSEGSQNVSDNRVPGVPEHRATGWARLTTHGVVSRMSMLTASYVWADDANTARAPGFLTLDLNVSYQSARLPITPFVQISNLLDARYAGSVALNANAGRYFEPAAGRGIQAGVSWKIR